LTAPHSVTLRAARLRQHLSTSMDTSSDEDPSLLWAAVAIILTPQPDSILLIRRADRSGDPWSGHMALPGGRREPGDSDLAGTAIRETAEEVGIRLRPEDLLGRLPDVIPRTPVLPPIAVRPFVFLLPERPAMRLNAEVAQASWVQVDYLLRPDTRHPVQLEVSGKSRQVQAYQLENAIIWGMTERILTSFLAEIG
jgi:8-oxo-dGTP pyrophosphatase MutT (NUDIX family)